MTIANFEECLKHPQPLPNILKIVKTLLSNEQLQNTLISIQKLGKKAILSAADTMQLKSYYGIICDRLWTIRLLEATTYIGAGLNTILTLIRAIIQTIIYAFSGNVSQSLFGTYSLTVQVGRTDVALKSSIDIESYTDISKLYEALQDLEKKSIPWKRYLERAFVLILPMLILIVLFTMFTKPIISSWLISAIMPISINLLRTTIQQLHYFTQCNLIITFCSVM